jgi:hypothetical protein
MMDDHVLNGERMSKKLLLSVILSLNQCGVPQIYALPCIKIKMLFRTIAAAAAVCGLTSVSEAALSAGDCTLVYINAEGGACDNLAAFAKCLASAPAGVSLLEGEKALSQAQEKTTGCTITVAPSFSVVDREVGGLIFLASLGGGSLGVLWLN